MTESVTYDEFEAVSHAQWQQAVEKTTSLSALSGRVDVTGQDALSTQPLYGPAPHGVTGRCPEAPWVVAQEYGLRSPEQVATAIAKDRALGLGAAWIRLSGSLRARASATNRGVVLTDREHARAITRAAEGAHVWIDAGANGLSALALMLESAEPQALQGGALCDPFGAAVEHGGLGLSLDEAIANTGRAVARVSVEAPQLRTVLASGLPYHDAGAAPSVELGATVATLIEITRKLAATGLDPATLWSSTVLRIAAESDVFVGIAKVRALRWVAERVAARFGADEPAFVAVRTARRDRTHHDPWVNMLRTTVETFGAAAGGADEIAAQPFSETRGTPNDDARRWAMTTAHMLREESHLAAVVDPAAGSGYVEALTRGLAERAWAWVQSVESAGGMASALVSGRVQADVAGSAKARADALATGELALTGVSVFPQLDEPDVPVGEDPEASGAIVEPADPPVFTIEALHVQRLAAPFEALRDAAERYQTSKGHRPRAQLYTLGSRREHSARLDFARNTMWVGGFACDVVSTVDDVVPSVVIVVASDERLGSEGAQAVSAIRAAGARTVWVASTVRDDLAVDGFLHRGMNVPGTLEALHTMLEVG